MEDSRANIHAEGVEAWLAGLRVEELVSKTYRAYPLRRVMIPKPGGGERPLGRPDDPGLGDFSRRQARPGTGLRGGLRGYRLWLSPLRRSASDAVKETHRLICRGYTDVVDADLSKYFDLTPALGPPQVQLPDVSSTGMCCS